MFAVSCCRFLILLLIFVFCLAPSALGQDELLTQAPDEYRAYGTVVDDQGQAISNAKVSLVKTPEKWQSGSPTETLCLSPTVEAVSCTEDGKFDIRVPSTAPSWNVTNCLSHHLLVIEATGFETSVTNVNRQRLLIDLPFSIATKACKPWTLRVLDKDGAAITDAKLQVRKINNRYLPLKFELENEPAPTEGGAYEINGASPDSLQGVYLSQKTSLNFYLPVQSNEDGPFVQLPETGIVKGTFKLPDSISPAKLVGKEIIIASFQQRVPDGYHSWSVLQLDENASATATHVAFGWTIMELLDQPPIPLCQTPEDRGPQPILSKENSPLEITHKLCQCQKIELRFENESGESIPNVQAMTIGSKPRGENSNGIVTIRTPNDDKPAGQLFLYDPSNQYQINSGFGVMLNQLEMKDGKPEPKPITMTRSRSIKGRVTDEQGHGVAGAKVEYTYSREQRPLTFTRSVLANRFGNFRIDGLPANKTVTLKAQKDKLATPNDAKISVTSGHTEDVLLPVAADH